MISGGEGQSSDDQPRDDTPERSLPAAPLESVPPLSAEELVLVDGGHVEDDVEEERRYPSTIGGAIYLLVVGAVVVGLVIAAVSDWRAGIRVMSIALFVGAGVRLLLRPRDAGMLAVRHKLLDAVVLVAFGAALFFLAGSIPDQP